MTATINLATEWGRQRLVRAVEGNDVIAYPTEAVWGLAVTPGASLPLIPYWR